MSNPVYVKQARYEESREKRAAGQFLYAVYYSPRSQNSSAKFIVTEKSPGVPKKWRIQFYSPKRYMAKNWAIKKAREWVNSFLRYDKLGVEDMTNLPNPKMTWYYRDGKAPQVPRPKAKSLAKNFYFPPVARAKIGLPRGWHPPVVPKSRPPAEDFDEDDIDLLEFL